MPKEILWRKKEAFSDGVSSKQKSLFTILQDNIKTEKISYEFNSPQTIEQSYYRNLFEKYYSGSYNIIHNFWMPKYINATDPSARTLTIYK